MFQLCNHWRVKTSYSGENIANAHCCRYELSWYKYGNS
jgi:hypothetical protein